jgi:ABC-type polysaccharide/polyol phosphate transport system ATPase subunit
MKAELKAQNLSKTYGQLTIRTFPWFRFRRRRGAQVSALKKVSFEIEPGETVGLIGRNGSGKSTLLQLICGILQPTSGTVQAAGKITPLLEIGGGFIPDLTGRQNVQIKCALMGLSKEETQAALPLVFAFSELGPFVDRPVRTYSSGMHVRLAYATAIQTQPDILVIDEVLAVGDSAFQAKCLAHFKTLQSNGTTILLASHSPSVIAQYCDRALFLNHGRLIAFDKPKSVIDHYHRLLYDDRLHNPPAANLAGEAAPNRYGKGEIEILKASVKTAGGKSVEHVDQHQAIVIQIQARFNKAVPQAGFLFALRNPLGILLYGESTQQQGIDFSVIEAGQTVTIRFEHTIQLNPGTYLLSLGAETWVNDRRIAQDFRDDAFPLQVLGAANPIGIFDAQSEIHWQVEPD